MVLTLLGSAQLYYNSGQDFQMRIEAAVGRIALDVLQEDAGTPNHDDRVVWANTAMDNIRGMAIRMKWAIISHSLVETDGTAIDDEDLEAVVSSFVDNFAG